jgi:hypothetical protein
MGLHGLLQGQLYLFIGIFLLVRHIKNKLRIFFSLLIFITTNTGMFFISTLHTEVRLSRRNIHSRLICKDAFAHFNSPTVHVVTFQDARYFLCYFISAFLVSSLGNTTNTHARNVNEKMERKCVKIGRFIIIC